MNVGEVAYPDVVFPPQHTAQIRQLTPARRLMIAVLVDAIDCMVKYRSAPDGPGRRLFVEDNEWLLSTDVRWPYSFECICDVLDLDAATVRAGLCVASNPPSGSEGLLHSPSPERTVEQRDSVKAKYGPQVSRRYDLGELDAHRHDRMRGTTAHCRAR